MTDKDADEKPRFFVSRRGRQVGVHEVDLKGIDIESKDNSAVTSLSKKVDRPHRVNEVTTRTWSKKKIVIAAVLIVAIALPVACAEIITSQYQGASSNASQDLANIVQHDVLPLQKNTAISATQIKKSADDVNDLVGHMCRGGLIDNIASLYPRAKKGLASCKTSQSEYAALASSLYVIEKQARYLEQVDVSMKPVALPTTDTYAVIGSQQTLWQGASEKLKSLSPPDSMKSAHTDLVAHSSALSEAWSKLNTANNTQDASAFSEAEKALNAEYESIRAISPQFTAVLRDSQTKLTTAYNDIRE